MWSTAKVTSLAVIFGLECLCGGIGCVFIKLMADKLGFSLQRTISYLNCLTGGVFLATSVIYLLPEAREKVAEALVELDFHTEYPFTELLTGIGFILILLLETSAHSCCHPRGQHHDVSVEMNGKRTGKGDGVVPVAASYGALGNEKTLEEKEGKNGTTGANSTDSGVHTNSTLCTDIENGPKTAADTTDVPNSVSFAGGGLKDDAGSSTNESDIVRDKKTSTKIRGIVLLIAYSLHMIFDGLALGLLDNDDQVWTLLLTLCVHKVLVFFTIGFQLYEILNSLWKSFLMVVVLSLVSPVGICIGIALTSQETSTATAVATGVLQGLATGTFLYVTFFEILCREFIEKTPHVLQVLVTFVGFAAVSAIGILHEDESGGHGMDEGTTVMPNLTTDGL